MDARRCTSKGCLISAENQSRLFSFDMPVVTILHKPNEEWARLASGGQNMRVASKGGRKIDIDWAKFKMDDYLFSHCSILCSVKVADNGYYIEPPCGELVNANGNAWSTPVLLATFKSFVNAENYYEHIQVPELSKGKILDAVLRPVTYAGEKGGKADVYYCFVGDSKVLMSDGKEKDIKDIEVGEEVFSGDGVKRTVVALSRNFSDDIVQLGLRGELDIVGCTSGHRIWAKENISDDWALIEAGKVEKNWWVFQPRPTCAEDVSVSPDFAWLAGTYAAEGSLIERKDKNGEKYFSHVQFTCHDSDANEIVSCVQSVLNEVGPYEVPFFTQRYSGEKLYRKVDGTFDVKSTSENGSNIRMGHRVIASRYFDLCGRKSCDKSISTEILIGWDRESKLHFLAGLIDGDGHARGNVVSLKSTSNQMIRDVEFILSSLGMAYSTSGHWHNGPYSGCPTIELDCYSSEALRPYLRIKNDFDVAPVKVSMGNRASIACNGGIARRVESVEKLNSSVFVPVYNIEVEEDHNYIVSGMKVKNCDILVATSREHSELTGRIASGELTTMSMGCGLAGTPVNLPDGTVKNIESVEVGDDVLTHTGNIRKVTSLFEHAAQDVPLFSVEYSGGPEPLRLTGEHPILIATKDSTRCVYSNKPCRVDIDQSQCRYNLSLPWRCAGARKPCGRDKASYEYDMKFVPISEVSTGDYIAKVFPIEEKDNDLFTEDICRLFGIYLGDGYIGWNWNKEERTKSTPAYVEFCLGTNEKSLIAEVKSLLANISPNAKIVERVVKERSGTYIKVWDSNLAELFIQHGGEGAWTKKISNDVMLLPRHKQELILSGLLDTDGCFYEKKGTLHFSTASKNLWNQTHLLLLRLGVGNRQTMVFRSASGFKKKSSSDKYWQYEIFIGSANSRMVKCAKNKLFGTEPETRSDECFFYKNYYLCPIKRVSSVRVSAKVYNFSVEEDESYAVGNVACHNCLAHIVQCSKCGKEIHDDRENCIHLKQELLRDFTDSKGVKRVVAELCGRCSKKGDKLVGDPESVEFIEASWVEKPAFKGAVLNHYVSEVPQKAASILELPNHQLELLFEDLSHVRVADVEGMMALRVACAELERRRHEAMVGRIVRSARKRLG